MLKGLEGYTYEITEREKLLIPFIMESLKGRTKDNRITGKVIEKKTNEWVDKKNTKIAYQGYVIMKGHKYTKPFLKINNARLNKIIQYLRGESILPVIAVGVGYYVSYDPKDMLAEQESLEQRARGVLIGALGLEKMRMEIEAKELEKSKRLEFDDIV